RPGPGVDDMRMRRFTVVLAGAVLCGLLGCVERQSSPPAPAPAPQSDPSPKPAATTQTPFDERLLQIARSYQSFGQVDPKMRWAPALCAAPSSIGPPELRVSASKDQDTHGRKLYAVFALVHQEDSYIKAGQPSPVDQVIVKESWVPEEVKDDGKRR